MTQVVYVLVVLFVNGAGQLHEVEPDVFDSLEDCQNELPFVLLNDVEKTVVGVRCDRREQKRR